MCFKTGYKHINGLESWDQCYGIHPLTSLDFNWLWNKEQ